MLTFSSNVRLRETMGNKGSTVSEVQKLLDYYI